MIRIFYNLVIVPLLWTVFRVLSLRDEKARLAFSRRKNLFAELEEKCNKLPTDKKRVLVHASSVGEYLQARPLILALKENFPGIAVILSFLSASLEGQLPRNPAADMETYLTFDTPDAVRRFLDLVKPDLIVFSTYDVWPNFLWQASDRRIPKALVNASLAKSSGRFRPGVRWFFGSIYSQLERIGAISENDAERYRLLGIPAGKIEVTGNCRFDQTIERARNVSEDDPLLAHLPKGGPVIIAGSTWPDDEAELLPAFFKLASGFPDLNIIIAPHEPEEHRLSDMEKRLAADGIACRRLSVPGEAGRDDARAILVDGVGYLFKLYKVGSIAFIGGSFGRAVHNVMEPAAFGLPVFFGPRHENSQEALLMKERGGAFAVSGREELEKRMHALISDERARSLAGEKARGTVEDNLGATGRTLEFLVRRFPDVFK